MTRRTAREPDRSADKEDKKGPEPGPDRRCTGDISGRTEGDV